MMNKKETKEFEALRSENEKLKQALLGQTNNEVPKPFVYDWESFKAQDKKIIQGWTFNAVLSFHSPYRVEQVWSIGHSHYFNPELKNGSQGSGILYRTKAEALLAARAKLQKDFDRVMTQLNREIGRESL